jgi:phage gpG-like protein
MFRFRLDIAGEVAMDRGISCFADGVTDFRPIWGVIADDFYARVVAQFETKGEEGGQRWPELSEKYAAWKERHFPGRSILQRTGALMTSLTAGRVQGAPSGAVKIEERKALTLGTTVPYAIYHQSPLPRKRLPRRPMIALEQNDQRQIMRSIHEYVVQMATRCGFRTGMAPLELSQMAAGFEGKPSGAWSPWGMLHVA